MAMPLDPRLWALPSPPSPVGGGLPPPAPQAPAPQSDEEVLRSVLDTFAPPPAPPKIRPDMGINIGGRNLVKGTTMEAVRPYLATLYQNLAEQPLGDQPHQKVLGIAARVGAGGYLGAQADREAKNKAEQERYQKEVDFRKQKASELAKGLAQHRWSQKDSRYFLTPEEAKAMGANYNTTDPVTSLIKGEAMHRARPQLPSAIDAGFNPDSVAASIVEGTSPAHPSGYAKGQWGKISTSLHEKYPDFNLAKAQMYWLATQRTLMTVNGTRFALMYNASNTLDDQLDLMDKASQSLEVLLPRSKWDKLNGLNVDTFAREMGANGQDIKDAAQAYYTQAALMQSELAQVFQAGGVPTEEAMKMAQKALPIHANFATMHKLINSKDGIVRKDLRLRQSAIRNFSPIIPGYNMYWNQGGNEDGGLPEDRVPEPLTPVPGSMPSNPRGSAFNDGD